MLFVVCHLNHNRAATSWREFPGPITGRSKAKLIQSRTTCYNDLKIALHNIIQLTYQLWSNGVPSFFTLLLKIWPLSWDKGCKRSEQQLITHLDWKFNSSYYNCVQINAYCELKMQYFWRVQVNHFSRLSRDASSSFSTGYGKELFHKSIEVIGGICSW